MRTITATRRFEWDSGHRVLGHGGKCQHLHGHRYAAEVTVEVPELDHLGMVVDFGDLKMKIGKWIDENWDHALILHPEDPVLLTLIQAGEMRVLTLPDGRNPTAEHIADVLHDVASSLLGPPFRVTEVKVYETPNCWAVSKVVR